jgi:ABC-type ATPase with predicted acetyltransferase domain
MEEYAKEMITLIDSMSSDEKRKTLLAFMLRDGILIDEVNSVSEDLSILNVDKELSKLNKRFTKKYKLN